MNVQIYLNIYDKSFGSLKKTLIFVSQTTKDIVNQVCREAYSWGRKSS